MDVHRIRGQSRSNIPRAPEMVEQTGIYIFFLFQAEGKLLAKVAGQGKLDAPSALCGIEADGYNLAVGLKKATLSTGAEKAKVGAHFTADTKSGIE